MSGRIFAFVTATKVTPGTDGRTDVEDCTEEYGWVDPHFSSWALFDSRNDATPVVNCDEDDEDLADYVREALAEYGPAEDNGDGTFYGQDEFEHNGSFFTYAVHFVRKGGASENWTERAWHPVTDGRITL